MSELPRLQLSVPPARAAGGGALSTVAVFLLAASWVAPFLQPFHAPPLPAFYSEWLAIALSIAAVVCLLCDRPFPQWHWHRGVSLCLLGLGALILLQWGVGMVPYPGIALTAALYLAWAVLLMSAASMLCERLGRERTISVLAVALCIAGLISAGVAVVQFLRVGFPYPLMIYPSPDGVHYGNIGQRNHLAHFVALAVVSVVYLGCTRRVGAVTAALCLALLTLAAALTASRSFWVYSAGIFLLAVCYHRSRPQGLAARPALTLCVVSLLFLVAWNVLLPFLDAGGYFIQTAAQRIIPPVEHRPVLWKEALDMFLRHPVAGVGFGRFGAEHFALQTSGEPVVGLASHAHNILLQLAAECGIAGLIVFAAFAVTVIRMVRWRRAGLDRWWVLALLLVSAVHSMVEYPLWYAYFLGIAATALGLLAEPGRRFPVTAPIRLTLVLALCGILANTFWTALSYARLERVMTIVGLYSDQAYDTLLQSLRDPLLEPHAEWTVASVMPVDSSDLTYKLRLNARVMAFMPSDAIAYQRAYLLALSGQREQAMSRLREAMTAYPDERRVEIRRLTYLARSHPLPFLPLLEFMRQDARASMPR